jgi:hypothetical protein
MKAAAASIAGPFADGASRPVLGVTALALGLFAVWMAWIVHRFLDGRGWFDLIVGLILDELILTIGLFALLLLVWAMFAPAWLTRLLSTAYQKVSWVVAFVAFLFGAGLLLVILGSALLLLGIAK